MVQPLNNNKNNTQQQYVVPLSSSSSYTTLLRSWILTIVWPGLGLLGESYVVFSLGTVPALLASNSSSSSSGSLLPSTSAAVLITSIIIGMLTMGTAASIYGRRWGSIGTALCMCAGSLGIGWFGSSSSTTTTSTTTTTTSSLLVSIAVGLLGLGVGGEYPMAAASASERRPAATDDDDVGDTNTNNFFTRGQQIQLVFSMQGMGILLHCSVLWFLLVVFQLDGDDTTTTTTNNAKVRWLWRILYGIGVVLLGTLFLTRVLHLKESSVWEQDRKQQQQLAAATNNTLQQAIMMIDSSSCCAADNTDNDDDDDPQGTIQLCPTVSSLSSPSVVLKDVYQQQQQQRSPSSPTAATSQPEELYLEQRSPAAAENSSSSRTLSTAALAWELYGFRLIGVSLAWFLWDVAFYGNKLFQTAFLSALLGDNDDTTTRMAAAATANAAVAAGGYLTAAALIDRVGRRTLQLAGFGATGVLFVLVGVGLDVAWPSTVLIGLYLGTSFVGQVGPNATTFLVPAEVFPTALRTTVHGIAAATGKLGALAASVVFTRLLASVEAEDDDTTTTTTAASSPSDLFLYSGYASLLGAVVTYWTIPYDNASLSAIDRQWRQAVDHGRVYAVPTCLSVYERIVWERKQQARNGEYLTSDVHNAVYA